jgi:hypothetical protein
MSGSRSSSVAFCLVVGLAGACATAVEDGEGPTGTFEMPLVAPGAAGVKYALTGTIRIAGPTTLELAAGSGDTLSAELPVGDYTLTLEGGWTMTQISAGDETVVDAALVTPNPVTFSLLERRVTWVRLEFEVGKKHINLGSGLLDIGIDVDDGLIDDFEDTDSFIVTVAGRRGSWFMTGDGTGTMNHPDGAAALPQTGGLDGGLAMRATGGGFQDWGASLVATFNDFNPYDASRYAGLRFSYRSATPLTVDLQTPQCHGACAYGFPLEATGGSWVAVEIPWRSFARPPDVGSLHPDQLSLVAWRVGAGEPFDFWLDDVELAQP